MAKHKKGPAYERKFAKQLSLWWSFGIHDDVFWRTSQSGGRATQRFKKGKRTADAYGDIGAERDSGRPLTRSTFFELKRGYTGKKGKKSLAWVSITDLLDTPEGFKKLPVLLEWWREANIKRKQAGRKRVFIIFRRDRKHAMIMMSRKVFKWLEKHNGPMMCPPYYGYSWITLRGYDLMCIRVDDFFKWCDPRALGAKRKIRRRK